MSQSDLRIAVYTGSFDPVTLGHLNVIQRCSRLVDRLVVGIGVNLDKQSLFTVDERVPASSTTLRSGRLTVWRSISSARPVPGSWFAAFAR